jgi:hypothetical protein
MGNHRQRGFHIHIEPSVASDFYDRVGLIDDSTLPQYSDSGKDASRIDRAEIDDDFKVIGYFQTKGPDRGCRHPPGDLKSHLKGRIGSNIRGAPGKA